MHRIKSLVLVAVVLSFSLLIIIPANAKSLTAGFAAGTEIATPNGNIAVEKLQPGDRVIGYDLANNETKENIVQAINRKSALSYYLINGKTKITGISLVYVKTQKNPQLLTPHQLKLHANLFGQNHSSIEVKSVEKIVNPDDIYEINLDNSKGNLFTDGMLIYSGTELPALYREYYIRCEYTDNNIYQICVNIHSNNYQGFVLALVILLVAIVVLGTVIPKAFIYSRNAIRFYNVSFTSDASLIAFTQNINPKFKNKYSLKYSQGNKVWHRIELQPEIEAEQYQHLLERTELIDQVNDLFCKHYQDLADKKLSENYQIVYQPELLELAVTSFDSEINTLRVQMNYQLINFTISPTGYVLTGDAHVKQHSEYWDFAIASDHRCYILSVDDTLATKILQGDLQARREAYADSY